MVRYLPRLLGVEENAARRLLVEVAAFEFDELPFLYFVEEDDGNLGL